MRLIWVPAALVIGLFVAIVLATNVFRPPPASQRLAGVSVAITGYTVEELAGDRHRLRLTISVSSAVTLDECIGFTLDGPFAGRRLDNPVTGCVKPQAGRQTAALTFDRLSEDDLAFPAHTLVWGIPGGRCGIVLELFGVCVVEQAGTADLELPSRSVLPSFGPLGSFLPIFSFAPP